MLDDIDYSNLTATSTSAAPTSEPKKKSNIAERSVVKKQDKPARKEVDVESLSEKAKEIQSDLGAPQIPDPLAQYGLPALGALGALGTAYGVYKSMQNKAPTPNAPMTPAPAAGPDYSAYNSPAYLRNAPVAPPAPVEAAPVPQAVAPNRLQQAQELAEANRQLGIGNQPLNITAPPEPISTPITAAPVDAPAPTPTPGPNSPVTTIVNDTVKELIQETPDPVTGAVSKPVAPPQELRTGTGKPAFAGIGPEAALNKKGEPKLKVDYASVADVPSGYAFVPGAQYIDTPRQNLGQLEYTKAYTDRPFPLTNEQAIQESRDINKLLGRATRAEAKAAGLPPAELTPGITKKTSAGTKPVRVAGTLGALMAISDLAKAETAAQRGMAGANLLEAVVPPGFMMGSAGEGSSNVPSFDQAVLLGSPYAQTEFAKKKRQELEYNRKVNRAIAPPMR
jgi:hypothetical protein